MPNKQYQFDKGLNEQIVRAISQQKNEDSYMCELRVKAYQQFVIHPNPTWTSDLNDAMDFNQFIYYANNLNGIKHNWDDVPEKIKQTFAQLGIIEAEAKFLSGASTQLDSEIIYHKHQQELEDKGVIFCDTDSAYKLHPELFKKYFNKIVAYTDNKYAALNTAVWSGGTFIYVPPNTHLEKPLQAYFRINVQALGQFERTLIIVDKNSSLHYIEGCTAPIYSSNNLHAAVVEIYVEENATMKYTTIQNWSDNVLNYVTKRALVKRNASMTWVDGNIGSKHNIKFPCCVLAEEYARGSCISVAVANPGVIQDSGAKMIHLAPYTKSNIVSKSIGYKNSKSIFRSLVKIDKKALHAKANITCDTLLMDGDLLSETIPMESVGNKTSSIEHEASISKINAQQLDYLMSRGLSKKTATHLLVLGFIDIFTKELPMEYAVELNRLLKLEL